MTELLLLPLVGPKLEFESFVSELEHYGGQTGLYKYYLSNLRN